MRYESSLCSVCITAVLHQLMLDYTYCDDIPARPTPVIIGSLYTIIVDMIDEYSSFEPNDSLK